jgi:hypothetical protein
MVGVLIHTNWRGIVTRHVNIVSEIVFKHIYRLCIKYCFKSRVKNLATAQNFEVISDEFNIDEIYSQVMNSLKLKQNHANIIGNNISVGS